MTARPATAADGIFLADLGLRLRTQDGMGSERGPSHATAHPVYMVQERERVYGIDTSHTDPDGYVLGDDDGDAPVDLPVEAGERVDDAVPYINQWVFVQGAVALTRDGIEAYLAVNGHNLKEPRVWVGSMYRVEEMIRLVAILGDPKATGLEFHVAMNQAADDLPRERWDAAQRIARSDIGQDYLDSKWPEWRRGGLMWLAGRTSEAERDAVYAAVIEKARETSGS